MHRKQRDIGPNLAQGRHMDMNDIQPEIQILPETVLPDFLFEVFVGGRDEANIHRHRAATAYPLHLALLQNAQQLGLGRQTQITDFVQEKRSPVRRFDAAKRRSTPVATPFSMPNSSLSTRDSGNAAQLTATNGFARRVLV